MDAKKVDVVVVVVEVKEETIRYDIRRIVVFVDVTLYYKLLLTFGIGHC